MTARKLLISLHDVTPFHLPRLRLAEEVFRELGIGKVAYLFVPQYHGSYPGAENPEFLIWCRRARPFELEWHLHGFHHLETEAAGASAPGDAFKRRFLTAGEGEFLALDEAAQRRKLEAGLAAFRGCFPAQAHPAGFVAPAWLFNDRLFPLLREFRLPFTEDHRRIYRIDIDPRRAAAPPAGLDCPVITWATRTLLRKYGSLVVCPALARIWSARPLLRVAMHPFDFDHPETVRSIKGVLRMLLRGGEQAFVSELDFSAARGA